MEYLKSKSIYLLIFGLFLCLISPLLLSDGMFLDGIIYASVSKNLSQGIGTFWNPHFTDTRYAEFHEHPPLVFGLLSIFYRIFDDHVYVEKIYSLSTILIQAVLIHLIWKKIKINNESWIPILIWFCFPFISWTATNKDRKSVV